jgi:hypothetical protein
MEKRQTEQNHTDYRNDGRQSARLMRTHHSPPLVNFSSLILPPLMISTVKVRGGAAGGAVRVLTGRTPGALAAGAASL